jgi:serine/threonine protein kinase
METSASHPLEQQQLGDFVIGREIGRGGMGVVYEAQQTSLNRRVALKVLSANVGLTSKAVQRFHREAEAAAKLHHTNIVPIYATGEQNGTHFYAMELIEGPSLDQVIRQLRQGAGGDGTQRATPNPDAVDSTPLEITTPYAAIPGAPSPASGLSSSSLTSGSGYFDTVARMIAEVADALDYAHKQGVIHRDIKPSNLLLSPAGRLSVNDFGLARLLEQPGMTITGEMVGTPRYMSPEQITAGRVPVDHRTDIYSLGATLYELLTLRPPFLAEHRDQLLAQILQKEPTPPRKVNPKIPVDLETICLKALDKDPDRRYQTAGQMAEDLRRYVNRFAILARRIGPVARFQKWVKRNPALSAAVAAILLIAGVAGGLAYRSHVQEVAHQQELAKVEQERLDEKRRNALDKALLASRLEDFEGARQAIREAEKLGCSPGQVRMLQGQLELYQGHTKEAIEQLRQAVDLLPESVAAWAMLSVACGNDARGPESYRALNEATRLPAVTPEDYLFRGHAESGLDPERGLKTLDEAVRQRPSALARVIRTEALRMYMLDWPDVDKAKLAMDDVQSIKRQYPENAMVLGLSILVHLACYNIFDEFHESSLRQAALDEGLKEAHALERFPKSSKAVTARWVFLKGIGQEEVCIPDLQQVSTTKDLPSCYYLGQYLYKRGDFAGAFKVFDLNKGETSVDLVNRVLTLAELHGIEQANKEFDEIAARGLSDWDLFNSQLILRILGRKPEAVEVSRKFLMQPDHFPAVRKEPFRLALEYCAGQRTADDLIASLHGNRGDLVNAYLCIGVTALADGDRASAIKHFKRCLELKHYEYLPYDLSQMLLSRLDKNPTWPPWIKVSK